MPGPSHEARRSLHCWQSIVVSVMDEGREEERELRDVWECPSGKDDISGSALAN